MDLPADPPVRLNLGAGDKRLKGYLSVGLQADHDVVCDVRAIPLPDDYADEAVAIHVLEHLERWDAPAALLEWRRVLKPGGLLVLELPDLIKCCKNILGLADEQEGLLGLWGDPRHREPLMMHRWGWTVREVADELRSAGFRKIKQRSPQFHGERHWRDMRVEARK